MRSDRIAGRFRFNRGYCRNYCRNIHSPCSLRRLLCDRMCVWCRCDLLTVHVTLNIDLFAARLGNVDLQSGRDSGESADSRQRLTRPLKTKLRRFQKILPEPPGLKTKTFPAQNFTIVILFRTTQMQLRRKQVVYVHLLQCRRTIVVHLFLQNVHVCPHKCIDHTGTRLLNE